METTVEELRKRASELGIQNYTSYKKVDLIKLIEEKEKPRVFSEPRGTASKEIYNLIMKHRDSKKWTLYKIAKMGGYSYTNVRRVYKKYIEPILNK